MAWVAPTPIMALPPSSSPQPLQPVRVPATIVIGNCLIETYPSIAQVPFASVRDQRGKAIKTSEHERFDELYGRCRTCMGHKSGEQLLLCDDCDRGFHMTCLVPILRDVPKGEWHCPNCTRDRNHTFHFRATAVATMRKVIADIETRPTLPPKLRHKLLDIPKPAVRFTRKLAPVTALVQEHPNSPLNKPPPPQPSQPNWRTLPANKRIRKRPPPKAPPPSNFTLPESTRVCKKLMPESTRRRRNHLANLARDLAPLAARLGNAHAMNSLRGIQDSLESIGKSNTTSNPSRVPPEPNSHPPPQQRSHPPGPSSARL